MSPLDRPGSRLVAKLGAAAAAALLSMVSAFEGTALRAYRDPIGVLTACSGHTGPDVRAGATYTREQCAAMLETDLVDHWDRIRPCIKVPLSDGEKTAYVSFAFNVGSGAFCGSTLARRLNAGDHPGACAELSRWTLAGGKQLPGLVTRRAAERAMCERR